MKPPWVEGVKNNAYNIGKRLAKDADIFYLGFSDNPEKLVLDSGQLSYMVKSPFYNTKYEKWFYPVGSLKLLREMKKIIAKEKPDMVFYAFQSASMGLLIGPVKRMLSKNAKHIQLVSGDWYSSNFTSLRTWLIEDLPQMLFTNHGISKMGMRYSDRIIATSCYMRNKIKAMGFDNVAFIPNGVDRKKYRHRDLRKKYDEDLVVSYVGHLTKAKGVGVLLQAFSQLTKKIDARLLLASTFGSEDYLIKKSAKNVTLFNIVNPEDIYSSSDVFALPRRTSYGAVTYPNVVLESMSCGVPVLTSNLPGISEIVKDGKTGFLCMPNSVDSLTKKLLEIAENRDQLKRVGRNAEELMEKYDWDIIVKDIKKEIL
jgi:glycosyltransferase involved in cell wall biosynthesis